MPNVIVQHADTYIMELILERAGKAGDFPTGGNIIQNSPSNDMTEDIGY